MPNNNRSLEIQLMRKFLCDFQWSALGLPDDLSNQFLPHIQACFPNYVGSLLDTTSCSPDRMTVQSWVFDESKYVLPKRSTLHAFHDDMIPSLNDLYSKLCNTMDSTCLSIPLCYSTFSSVKCIDNRNYQCSTRTSKVLYMVHWVFGNPENSDGFPFQFEELRPVEIESLIKHTIQQGDTYLTYLLAQVKWLKYHPDRYKYGKPLQVWHKSEYLTLLCVLYPCNFCPKNVPSWTQ